MTKKALVVGINYVGTGYDLRGCLNDAANMEALLKTYNFDSIEMCLEQQATTAGIKAAFERLIANVVPGDVLVFHYSGHGSQIPSTTEPDGVDEIICPYDLDWKANIITDDYMHATFNRVPNGVNVTVILDSCHSGNGLDQRSLMSSRTIIQGSSPVVVDTKGRYLAPPADMQAEVVSRQALLDISKRDVDVSAVLVAACEDSQTSADAKIGDTYQGAGTYSLISALKATPTMDYHDLVASMNSFMVAGGYTQRPQLNGPTNLYSQKVFQPWDFQMTQTAPAPVAASTPTPVVAPVIKQDKSMTYATIAIIVAVASFVVWRMLS